MNVLAIGAHPDDIELGCGGALLRHAARGDRVTMLVMTEGQRGTYRGESRLLEQRHAAELLEAQLLWGNFDDGAISTGPETITVIDEAIATAGAQIVYSHAPTDTHQDHRAVSIASLASARRVSSVLFYETPSTQSFQPSVFVDVDAVLQRKLHLLRVHHSQVTRDGPVDLDALAAQARFRGSACRMRNAEGFEAARFAWNLDDLPAEPAPPALRAVPDAARQLAFNRGGRSG